MQVTVGHAGAVQPVEQIHQAAEEARRHIPTPNPGKILPVDKRYRERVRVHPAREGWNTLHAGEPPVSRAFVADEQTAQAIPKPSGPVRVVLHGEAEA